MNAECMNPLAKITIASEIVRLYKGDPHNILLLPADTMYDHTRLVEAYSDAKYYAVEKDDKTATKIRRSGKFHKIYYNTLTNTDFGDTAFDIAYIDLTVTFSHKNLESICEFLRSDQFSVIPDRGQLLVITLLQRSARGANLIDQKSRTMDPEDYLKHVEDALRAELGIRVISKFVFDYQSGAAGNKCFVTCFFEIHK